MRTLVLTPDFPPTRGGIQLLVHSILLRATRLDSRIVTLRVPGSEEFDRAETRLDVRRGRKLPGPKPLTNGALNAHAIFEGLRFQPDAILSAHIVASPAAVLLRRLLGIPVVQYFHAKEIGARPALARFAARNADASVAVSHYTRDLLIEVGAPKDRIHCIHPGVESPPRGDRTAAEAPTVITIARLEDRYKGHDVMLRAMPLVRARIPDASWVVIGDGPLRASLGSIAHANGLCGPAVRFVGAVSDSERDLWLDRAHVFAMPSRLPAAGLAGEGFGIVYLEANAHGLPVVAGNVGGALDAVVHGETGLLVDPTDHVAVAAALTALLADPDLATRMGETGARRAKHLTWDSAARSIEDLFIDLGAGDSARSPSAADS